MTNETNNTDSQEQQDDFRVSITPERQRINRIANEAARRGRDRQERYDEGHNIFTK
jgi:hypothetical protein